VKPDAVVVELCDDRFLSISLDAKIRPRGNTTYEKWYDEKIEIISRREKQSQEAAASASYANFGLFAVFSQLTSAFRFAKSQGLFGGLFVLLGLFVSSMQRLSRSSMGDEFVTAMREAEKINIPVRLGDAPQNDTLNSIKNVISPDVFKLNNIVSGAKLLVRHKRYNDIVHFFLSWSMFSTYVNLSRAFSFLRCADSLIY
jgi:hypothetical protein